MRIIDVGDDRYQVVSQINSQNKEFIDKLTELYKERYNDFFLLKSQPNPEVNPHHLICRKIAEAEFTEIKTTKKKKKGHIVTTKG
jgi:hypothetical protein